MNQQPHLEYMRVAERFGLVFGIVSIPLAVLVGVGVTTFWGIAFGWSAIMVLLGAILLVIVAVLLMTVRAAQWMIMEREVTTFNRIDAETDAIKHASEGGGIVQTNNAAPGSTIKASIKAPRVSIRGKNITWNQLNQLTPAQPEVRRIEIPREDVLWMLEQFVKVKHSKRVFTSEKLPYCKFPAYPELYDEIIRVLVEGQAILGRSDRTAGRLVVQEVPELVKLVDGAHPKGVVLELPPQTGKESGI